MKHIQQFIPSLSETNQFSKDLINLDRRNPIEFKDSKKVNNKVNGYNRIQES